MKREARLHATEGPPIHAALREFAASVTAKTTQVTPGEPEEQVRGPFGTFLETAGQALGWRVVCTGETPLPDRLGRPDYAVHRNRLLAGYVEIKAPGVGAAATRFRGRNRQQFNRFSAIPNILYSDGNEWALYRGGELVGKVVRLSGDVAADGKGAAAPGDARAVEGLLRDFLSWEPFVPMGRDGRIDLRGFARQLAPLCRMLRDDVEDALEDEDSPLVELARDWRQLLFPDASDEQFADAYAQTVTFALLLGCSEGADPLTLDNAREALAAQHNLLSRALQVLTDPVARAEIAASVDLLLRVIDAVTPAALSGPEDPWLYFYEDFLAVYDARLRRDTGVYYTPVEVVRAQVRLIDDLLVHRLGKPLGFADPGVVTLDPAVGTGTYLLGVIEHALGRVRDEQGPGAVPGHATALAGNLYGFELLVGAYAVSELRVSLALQDAGARLPADGTRIYLTDTLESPHARPPQMPLILRPIAEQHKKALAVKSAVPVIVCLGNPPYDRHEADYGDQARTGGWVRWGDDGDPAILREFLDPAVAAGHGIHLKNLYNLYVYFWRWALWKVFEHETSNGPGVVSFISASSYLDGDAFSGMREHMRRQCDEVWILDLGGEGRGTRQDDNVFAIQTPVAIAVAFRAGKAETGNPARVRHARIEGTRAEKLGALDAVRAFSDVEWQDCPDGWLAPFHPAGRGDYFGWPQLTDLMPWQHSGVQFKRTWPIAPDEETLERRWRGLLSSPSPADLEKSLKETRDRKINSQCSPLFEDNEAGAPIVELPPDAPIPPVVRYAYRSFDRQSIIADTRLGDYLRPDLWRVHGDRQVYLTSLFSRPLGSGPALTSCAHLPDLHHFRGSYGAKEVIPLYRAQDASEANIAPALLQVLRSTCQRDVTPEDLLAYLYGALAQPAFTRRFEEELETRELCVPITKDGPLFEEVRQAGARLLWLHTYAERFVPPGQTPGRIPPGAARCVEAIPGHAEEIVYDEAARTLRISGGEFALSNPPCTSSRSPASRSCGPGSSTACRGGRQEIPPPSTTSPPRLDQPVHHGTAGIALGSRGDRGTISRTGEVARSRRRGRLHPGDELPPVPEEMRKPPSIRRTDTELSLRLP